MFRKKLLSLLLVNLLLGGLSFSALCQIVLMDRLLIIKSRKA